MNKMKPFLGGTILLCTPTLVMAEELTHATSHDLTTTWLGISAVILFAFSYALVVSEEFLHLRKSKPVMVAAGIIWVLVAVAFNELGDTTSA